MRIYPCVLLKIVANVLQCGHESQKASYAFPQSPTLFGGCALIGIASRVYGNRVLLMPESLVLAHFRSEGFASDGRFLWLLQ